MNINTLLENLEPCCNQISPVTLLAANYDYMLYCTLYKVSFCCYWSGYWDRWLPGLLVSWSGLNKFSRNDDKNFLSHADAWLAYDSARIVAYKYLQIVANIGTVSDNVSLQRVTGLTFPAKLDGIDSSPQ